VDSDKWGAKIRLKKPAFNMKAGLILFRAVVF